MYETTDPDLYLRLGHTDCMLRPPICIPQVAHVVVTKESTRVRCFLPPPLSGDI